MRSLLLILSLIFTVSLYAQVKVEATPTGKHAKALNKAKETREEVKARKAEVKERKQQYRETQKDLRQYRKAQKEYKKKYQYNYDSLAAYHRTQLKLDSTLMRDLPYDVPNISDYRNSMPDSVQWISQEDSLAISRKIMDESGLSEKHKALILNPPVPLSKAYFQSLDTVDVASEADSLARKEAESVAKDVASDYLPDELGSSEDPLNSLQDPLGDKTSLLEKRPARPNPNLIKPDQARELFKKVDPEQFKDAQLDMQKLKKKYSKLPDSRYPEEGTKRNSLQDIPFAKRLYVGGNLSLTSTDPLIVSSNLQLGYWMNKKWLLGVGISLREQFTTEDSTALVSGDGYGYSLFTRYDIKKGFFAWAEGESQLDRSFFRQEGATNQEEWQWAYLVGIGREFKVGKVQMMSLILYDLNYQNNTLNARPFVFRMGVRFNQKP